MSEAKRRKLPSFTFIDSSESKQLKIFLTIFGMVVCDFLLVIAVELFCPFTPDGTDAGTRAIEKYEATQCDGRIIVLSARKVNRKYSEGSWHESWKIKNACDEIHTFLIRFGVSPETKAFVIDFELVE
jgi:hypothetical protein